MSDKTIRVKFPGELKIDVEMKGFTIRTDQPEDEGGNGSAPAPFDLFLASIASCAGFYVLSFCRERSIPTDGLDIAMTTEKAEGAKMIEKIAIDIGLPAGFPEKYVPAVTRAAELCSVKAHIQKSPVFEIRAGVRGTP
jgi:putative redox protein